MNITEDFIIRFTGNPSAVSNGRALANTGSFQALYASGDGTLLFGSCKGSGKNPYNCSVDFTDPADPVPRCSCPSRQIPCKHVVGLLYCKLQGKPFAAQEVPEDIAAKRAKRQQREEKKAEKAAEPAKPAAMTKAKANAAIKKCRAQLEGMELAARILHNLVLAGLNAVDKASETRYAGQIKELGNYYIGGIQAALTDLLTEVALSRREQEFTDAVAQVSYLYALLKKAREYTHRRIADLEAFIAAPGAARTDTAEEAMLHSAIEEQIGTAWKLTELREKGLVMENAALLQVGFDCYDEEAKKQFADEGVWVSLNTGDIFLTKNYRPYRASKYVREEDTCFSVVETPELFRYPGDRNPRVRWDKAGQREATREDFTRAKAFARAEYAPVLKEVRAQIKNPLADKEPVFMLRIGKLLADPEGHLAAADGAGTVIPLAAGRFGFLLRRLAREQAEGQALVCRFAQDVKTGRLTATPVAVIHDDAVVRLTY